MKVAVVGGGIAGLAAAWELRNSAELTVFDPAGTGGKLVTTEFEGRPVDCGPDAFITRQPQAVELCAELGLDDLVAPAAGRALLWWGDHLRPLPEGLIMGAPARIGPVVRSGLIGPLGLLRAAADLVLPATKRAGDTSVRDLLARRFGAQVADRLADPLVSSIHAGRSEGLSAEATVPQLVAVARRSRSLFLGLRGSLPAGDGSPVFLAPRGGTQQLAAALDGRLRAEGVEFVTERVRVVRSEDRDGVAVDGGRFDACVLATDAAESAALLGDRAPAGLRSIATASVALVTMGGPEMELPEGTSGLLVPRRFGRLMTACSFASHKWPHWAAPGRAVLRVSAGRIADDRIDSLDDETLVGRLADELSSALGKPFRPETHRVSRWPDSFPQYRVGHLQLVDGIEEDLRRDHPGVAVCGASYRGVGIPACIGSGRAAARALVQRAG